MTKPISDFPAGKPRGSGKHKKPPAPPRLYPEGYFTPTWPPGFVSAFECRQGRLQEISGRALGQRMRETGAGWGSGTISLPNSPKHAAPGDM